MSKRNPIDHSPFDEPFISLDEIIKAQGVGPFDWDEYWNNEQAGCKDDNGEELESFLMDLRRWRTVDLKSSKPL